METRIDSDAYRALHRVAGSLETPEVREWRAAGGKVAGYFCSTVPDEVFTAAGVLPFRMRGTGSESTELADASYTSTNCSFPRHTFNQALMGEYDFLDALVVINSCDHVRRIYDNWIRQLDTSLVHVMSLPRKMEEPQVLWYYEEINILREKLAGEFGVEISDDDLRGAITAHNEIRRLQRSLYELRKAEHPVITGSETLPVIVAGTALPKPLYTELLGQLLEDLADAEPAPGDFGARVMLVGSELDDPEFVGIVEDQGALVVTDSICYGTRLMWVDVDEAEPDPAMALARYYIQDRPSCPRMYGGQPDRIAFVRQLAADFRVDGVIGERMNFCDQWQVEHFMMTSDLKEDGMPFLRLDRDYIISGKGQLRTRVQAFLERINGADS